MSCETEVRFLLTIGAGPRRELAVPTGVSALPLPEVIGASVELVRGGSRPVLLLRSDRGESVRLNGLPAPALAVLGLRDEVRIGEWVSLHLSVWRDPQIGAAPPDRRAEKCPVCLTAIGAGHTYLCPCGHLLHLDGEDVPDRDRLECARLVGRCAACDEEIRLQAGYLYEPEA